MYYSISMFLKLGHNKLDAYTIARQFITDCYKVVGRFHADEKYILIQQTKHAALSVHLNIAEGSSRRSDLERKGFYEISRGSIIEIDAALDIAADLGYCSADELQDLGGSLVNCFKYITGLINANSS